MNRTGKIAIIAVVTTTLLSGVAYAKFGGDRSERMLNRVSEHLDLDTNQQDALGNLSQELQESMQAIRGDRSEMKSQVRALISAETFDQGAALELINGKADALRENAPDVVAAAALFFDGLNAEQKSQIENVLEKASKHRGKHRRGWNHDESGE